MKIIYKILLDTSLRQTSGKCYLFCVVVSGSSYSRMAQLKFVGDCLPQILLGPFLNTLTNLKNDTFKNTTLNSLLSRHLLRRLLSTSPLFLIKNCLNRKGIII